MGQGHDEQKEGEPANPVGTGLDIVDGAHLTGDSFIEGGAPGKSMLEIGEDMEEKGNLFDPAIEADHMGLSSGTVIAAPLAIAGGIMEMYEGYEDIKKGDEGGSGTLSVGEGGLTTASGIAAIAGLAGSAVGAVAAPLLATGATGMKVGHYGDQQVQKLGWYHDEDGKAQTASSWMADQGTAANDWVTKQTGGDRVLGHTAGLETMGQSLPEAGGAATLAAMKGTNDKVIDPLVTTGRELGSDIAAMNRADHYDGYDAQLSTVDPKTGKTVVPEKGSVEARRADDDWANYDDEKDAAIARSKKEHPERWGLPPDQTYGQWMDQWTQIAARGGAKQQ